MAKTKKPTEENKYKIALALIVKGEDSEADVFARCLANASPFFDKIFITITHKQGEVPSEKIKKVADAFGAEISYFEWVYNFAKARNFNFKQVPKEYDYIMWLDADDILRGGENISKVINGNPSDAYHIAYYYHLDENNNPDVVHWKTQIVKNDGCVEWNEQAGNLHEDFKETRALNTYRISDALITRLHLSDDQRFENAKFRNLEIAKKQLIEFPEDPRSLWNLGNSLKAVGEDEEAIKIFESFISKSSSDDEKYIALLRISESYWHMGKKEDAIERARYAVGLKPHYPDAFNLLGSLHLETMRPKEAIDYIVMGLTRKPPYHSIIVYNPRDYDYVPLMNLAKAYFAAALPQLALIPLQACLKIYPNDQKTKKLVASVKKEAKKAEAVMKKYASLSKLSDARLEKALEKLPEDFKSMPMICNLRNTRFIKKESSGKDLVYYCGFTEKEWTPDTVKKGVGGSEEAVIHLAKKFHDAGWNVTVYNNCGHKELDFDGVKYKPFWSFNYRDKQDVAILWRMPTMADYEINSGKVFLDLHDVINPGELNEKRLGRINKIFVKSKSHRDIFDKVEDDKFIIVPNGIDPDALSIVMQKDPFLMVNTSSPDRGLNGLIDLFQEVKKRVPEAKLAWAYGWDIFDIVHSGNSEMFKWKESVVKKMQEAGVENLGRIGHDKIAELMSRASIFAYPTEFLEIDCISLTKAFVCGAYPVTTDFGALGEKQKIGGIFIHSEKTKDNWCPVGKYDFSITDEKMKKQWVDAVVEALTNPPSEEELKNIRESAIATFNWDKIAGTWLKEF